MNAELRAPGVHGLGGLGLGLGTQVEGQRPWRVRRSQALAKAPASSICSTISSMVTFIGR